MATQTSNIGLTKPDWNENVNLTVINENYDLIDDAVGECAEKIDDLTIATEEETQDMIDDYFGGGE